VVLCIEQYKNLQNIVPFIIGLVASITALILVPSDKMLIISILIALFLMFTFRRIVEKNE
jgi:predicted branched-subunit amino acid permease